MYNRLVLLRKAVYNANLAELVKDVIKNMGAKSHGATGSRIRLTVSGTGIQTGDARFVKAARRDHFFNELPNGILKPTRNIFVLLWGNQDINANPLLSKFVKDEKSYGCPATTRFGLDGKVENGYLKRERKTIKEAILNMSAAALTTIGLFLGFATFFSVSAATNPKQETNSGEESDEDSSTMSHFSQESSDRLKEDLFSFQNGTAFRDSEFPYVWKPSNFNPLDVLAAHEAARREAEKRRILIQERNVPL